MNITKEELEDFLKKASNCDIAGLIIEFVRPCIDYTTICEHKIPLCKECPYIFRKFETYSGLWKIIDKFCPSCGLKNCHFSGKNKESYYGIMRTTRKICLTINCFTTSEYYFHNFCRNCGEKTFIYENYLEILHKYKKLKMQNEQNAEANQDYKESKMQNGQEKQKLNKRHLSSKKRKGETMENPKKKQQKI